MLIINEVLLLYSIQCRGVEGRYILLGMDIRSSTLMGGCVLRSLLLMQICFNRYCINRILIFRSFVCLVFDQRILACLQMITCISFIINWWFTIYILYLLLTLKYIKKLNIVKYIKKICIFKIVYLKYKV